MSSIYVIVFIALPSNLILAFLRPKLIVVEHSVYNFPRNWTL